jgi:hypothetical protein
MKATLTQENLTELSNQNDAFDYIKIGSFYYRTGTYGLSIYDKKMNRIDTINDFRNKSLKQINEEIKNFQP